MDNTYSYLKPYCHRPGNSNNPTALISPFNSFGELYDGELAEAERILGQPFPKELKDFYKEIGVGKLMKSHNSPSDYHFSAVNEILSPISAANFAKGILFWEGQENWMAESAYEDLEPGDLPFFEIGDSCSFLLMKLNSDNPNAVWTHTGIKIEDSFEKFIWSLYYESPDFYGDIIEAAIKSK